MAKFCTNCGKKLEEGQTCECTKTVVASNGNLFNECLEIAKNFFKKPIDTLEENVDESKLTHAFIMLGVNGIAMGLFMMAIAKSLYSIMFAGYGSLMSLAAAQVKIPYVKIFFITFVVTIIVECLITLCSYLLSDKLFKGNTNIKKMITLFGFSSIIMSAATIVAAILSFINIYIALFVIAAGSMLKTYYNYKGLEFACDTDINKLGYILMPSVLVVSVVVGYLLPRIMM